MNQFLVTALVACLLLYRTLCGMFDVTQSASRAGVAAAEYNTNQITE